MCFSLFSTIQHYTNNFESERLKIAFFSEFLFIIEKNTNLIKAETNNVRITVYTQSRKVTEVSTTLRQI